MIGRLRSAIPFVFSLEETIDVERLPFAGIERTNAPVDLGAELAKFLDVRQELPTDQFLVGVREDRYLRDCLFKCLDHAGNIPPHPNFITARTGFFQRFLMPQN